jgi:hypothetical protein
MAPGFGGLDFGETGSKSQGDWAAS